MTTGPLTLARPLGLQHPLDIDDARVASRRLAEVRREAEDEHERRVTVAAEAERTYRKAWSKAFVTAEGSGALRDAVAKGETADLAYERDLSAGMVKVAAERLRGLEGERSQLKSLTEWSARMLLEGGRQ